MCCIILVKSWLSSKAQCKLELEIFCNLRFELYSAGCCGDEVAVASGCMLGSVWPGLGWGATIVCPQSGETPGPGH